MNALFETGLRRRFDNLLGGTLNYASCRCTGLAAGGREQGKRVLFYPLLAHGAIPPPHFLSPPSSLSLFLSLYASIYHPASDVVGLL